jgi:hypothetical protein
MNSVLVCVSLHTRPHALTRASAQAELSIFNGLMVIIEIRTSVREAGSLNDKEKEKRQMNRAWTAVLVALLVAATETLIEVVKRMKKKGEAT